MLRYLKVLTLFTTLALSFKVSSQQFIYNAGFWGFFDNREYFNSYVNDQTIFGTRVSGELGYSFNDNNRIMAGIDYLYEFGSKGELVAPDIVAYYHGQKDKLGIYIGAFPRVDKISMPFALMSDTISYYHPTVEGIMLEYHSDHFNHNIWIDWTSRQSYNKNEIFLLGFSGYSKKGIFTYQHHFVMTHFAHSLNRDSLTMEQHIRDNGAMSIMPGIDLTAFVPLDTLSFDCGLLASYDRIRNVYDFRFPVGFMAELNAGYKGFGVKGTFYAGDNQIITSGDGFYKSDKYGRADFFYQKTNSAISGKVQFSLHFLPGVMDVSMLLVVRASLDGVFKNHHSN